MPRSVCPTKCQLFCPHMDTGGPTAVEDDEDLNAHQVECPAQDSWCEMFVKQWTLPPMNENRWKKNMAEELSGWRSRERGVGERRRGQGITRMNTSLRAPIHPVLPSSHKKNKNFKTNFRFPLWSWLSQATEQDGRHICTVHAREYSCGSLHKLGVRGWENFRMRAIS